MTHYQDYLRQHKESVTIKQVGDRVWQGNGFGHSNADWIITDKQNGWVVELLGTRFGYIVKWQDGDMITHTNSFIMAKYHAVKALLESRVALTAEFSATNKVGGPLRWSAPTS